LNSGSAVYSATKFAVRAISEGLRQEVKAYNIRTTIISPGAVQSELTNSVQDPLLKENVARLANIAIDPISVARAVAFALEQDPECDVNEIVLRPTNQLP
jgi:NADP-dependent 3-hydroxy acid dehydrogenase YdfG